MKSEYAKILRNLIPVWKAHPNETPSEQFSKAVSVLVVHLESFANAFPDASTEILTDRAEKFRKKMEKTDSELKQNIASKTLLIWN